MKLLRLKLNVPFRSLPADFKVDFLREWDRDSFDEFHPYCLAGRNGSGKSNVLEALAAIFYHLECIYLDYRPNGFEFDEATTQGFQAEWCEPDAFELEYLIPDNAAKRGGVITTYKGQLIAHIRITKEAGKRPVIRYSAGFPDSKDAGEELSRQEVAFYLPQYVLGYSSGHNEILSLPFFKMRFIHFDEYRDKLIKKLDYPNRPEGRLIYLDDQFSQVILLCHFLFPSAAVTHIFKDKVNLEGFRCFRLIIRRFYRVEFENTPDTSQPAGQAQKPKETVELTANLSGIIDKLIRCSTTHYEDHTPYEDDDAYDLYLDFWVDDETRRAFHSHFGEGAGGSTELSKAASALNLFHALQTLLTLNYYRVDRQTKKELYGSPSLYVNETIPTPASHERIARFKDSRLIKSGISERIYLKNLSDGEHQLLHTIGLCLLFRHKPALFLLDEPETHLNPDWRASYVSTLRAAFEADKDTKNVMREVLLTSHSPFILSDCQQANVLIFKKDAETQTVSYYRPDFNTFGASANAITIKVFGRTETIGDYAMKKVNDLWQQLEAGVSPDELISEAGKTLGDSVEKILFINQALNQKEGKK